ncbi:hypothetical protein BDZ89DRAFT_1152334, partial [Hymenopellis radicata]
MPIPVFLDDSLESHITSPPIIRTVDLPPIISNPQTLEALKHRLSGIYFALQTRKLDNTGYLDTSLVDKCRHVDSLFIEPDIVARSAMGHPFSDIEVIPRYHRVARTFMQLFDGPADQHPLREHGIHYMRATDLQYDADHEDDTTAWVKEAWSMELYRLRARQDYSLDETSLDLRSAQPSVLDTAERIRSYKPIFNGLMQLSEFRSYNEPPLPPIVEREPLPPAWYKARLLE